MISAEEAKLAWANGEELQWRDDQFTEWSDLSNEFKLRIFNEVEFRLKPRTITINGVEVPACGTDYKPHTFMFVLNSLEPCEYSKIILDESDEIPPYWWQTEDEIKQVVAALRSIFNDH